MDIRGNNVNNWKPFNIYYNDTMIVTGLRPLTSGETHFSRIKNIISNLSKIYNINSTKVNKEGDIINIYLN